MCTPKMYVLVRNDLSEKYKFVQGGHALAQYALQFPEIFREWNNETICYLGVRNLIEIKKWVPKLAIENKFYSDFIEPDLDSQLTAIACYDSGEVFKSLPLA